MFQRFTLLAFNALLSIAIIRPVDAQDLTVEVDCTAKLHPVSRYLTGACIEDVNHEIYGGIYSQMIFGESFQEPASTSSVKGFTAYGGDWFANDGVVHSATANGNKLVSDRIIPADCDVTVEVWFENNSGGNAGLIVRTSQAGVGLDRFIGYEIALDPARQIVRLGRHRHDFVLLKDEPCQVPIGQWIPLRVVTKGSKLEVFVDSQRLITFDDREPILGDGQIGLRHFHNSNRYQGLTVTSNGTKQPIAFDSTENASMAVSRMWQPSQTGTAQGKYRLNDSGPLVGRQSQLVEYVSGEGRVGIVNKGLNGWGLAFEAGKTYGGEVYVKADQAATFVVAAESSDGSNLLAEQSLVIDSKEWTKLEFTLTPTGTVHDGRFAIKLQQPGSIQVGYVFLQPGEWGRFKGLPLRRDVVEGLINQGISVLRYGGSMVDNPPDYRWKKMIGPRALRQPYRGHWYDYSTNGWGIIDFMNLCEAAGFLGIPCFSVDETPQDMGDFLEYANGDAASKWGSQREEDGHRAPYQLSHLQIGNEESVDEAYWQRFEPIARQLWLADPKLVLVVGDFMFDETIADPYKFGGSPAGITSLATHQKILKLAKEFDAEVWFDTHIWTEGPNPTPSMNVFFSYVDAIDRLSDGAKHKVAVFEFNANNHRQKRALANAEMLGRIMRDGRVPVALSANCLQPDKQNDNGWDQGLLFLNRSQVWLQPPGYVTQMDARAWQPWVLKTNLQCDEKVSSELDIVATGESDGSTASLRIVNRSAEVREIDVSFSGSHFLKSTAEVTSLAAPLESSNTAEQPERITPTSSTVTLSGKSEAARIQIAPFSFTTIRFE